MPHPVKVGISFYTPKEFGRAKRPGLPGVSEFESYDEWLKENRKAVENLLKAGSGIVEIVVDADDCFKWCGANNVSGKGAVSNYVAEMLRLGKRIGRTYML